MTDVSTSTLQLNVLESLESAEHYNRWVADLVLPHLGESPIEIGSGIGVSASLWLDAGLPRITVSDLDPACLGELHGRFDGDDRVEVERLDLLTAPSADHSAVVAINVLEHIEDERTAIEGAARLVTPGGRIVFFVPAFSFATGRFDREIGHWRRYTLDSIGRAFADAGVRLVSARYVNAPGLLAWFAYVRLLRLTPGEGPLLRTWDRTVVQLARRVESHWRPPFGQSVLAIGEAGTP
jgi:ubiquinone/menaquinone biosynthesis C-methylase UbiE